MTSNQAYKDIIRAKKDAIFDPALTHTERVQGARSELQSIKNEPSFGAVDALSFAVPFGLIAAQTNLMINNAARDPIFRKDMEGAATDLVSIVKNKGDIAAKVPEILEKFSVDERGQKQVIKALETFKDKVTDSNALSHLKPIGEVKAKITDTILKSQPFQDEMLQSIEKNMVGGVRGAAIATAAVVGAAVMLGARAAKKEINEEIKSEIKTELSYVETEALRREMNELKAAVAER